MAAQSIKIYGERNTGTNYLARLVSRNLRAPLLRGVLPARLNRWIRRRERWRDLYFRWTFPRNLGWKHAVAPAPAEVRRLRRDAGSVLFLTLSKNPYAWLLSLHRNPYHATRPVGPFEEFLRTPWPTVGRERHPDPFPDPISMWNVKNASYLALGDSLACENLRYEDLLREPEALLAKLARNHGLERRQPGFHNVVKSTKSGGERFEDYQTYYLEERWRGDLGLSAVAWINERLDPDLMARLGYAYE